MGELGPYLTQSHLGRDLATYEVISWSMQPFGRNRYGRKLGGCAPLGEWELGPHLTQCDQDQGLPACQVSSRSVQPFGHSALTSQTGQDRQDRQRSDSIGRTVLQTVAQKRRTTKCRTNQKSQTTPRRHWNTGRISTCSRKYCTATISVTA